MRTIITSRGLLRMAVVGLIAAAAWIAAIGVASAQVDGAAVYEANCQQCHQAGAVGVEGAFPPLAGNPRIQDTEYLRATIRNGRQGEIEVLGVEYNGVMPAFGNLSDDELDAVVEYLLGLSGPETTTTTTQAGGGATVPGDAVAFGEAVLRGESLFVGSQSFSNGGPACFACHTAGERAAAAGPALGPDLTDAVDRLGLEGLQAAIATLHPDVMAGAYAGAPLTPTEQADLAAYLQSVSGERSDRFVDVLLIIGLGGFLLLVAYLAFIRSARSKEGEA